MAVETLITTALFERLKTLVLTPAYPVAWPNVPFTPPATGRYLQAFIFPVLKQAIAIADDGKNQHRGLLQIDVIQPTGGGVTNPAAEAIATHFKRGTRLYSGGQRVEIVSAKVERGFADGQSWKTPITITYRAFAPNT